MDNLKFTDLNPRAKRVLMQLTRGKLSREEIDRIAGASNGPEVIRGLRKHGFCIPCERQLKIDQDGKACYPGYYRLTKADRLRILAIAKRG